MSLKSRTLLIKICATALWIFLLVFPLARIQSEHVTITDSKITYNAEKRGDDMEITCDKKIVSGVAEIKVYEDETVIKTIKKEFEENKGYSFVIFIGEDEIPENATEYKLYDCRVKTETQENIEMICYMLAIVYIIFLPTIWRIKVYNTKINGNDVEIYRGFKKKYLKVNGNLVHEENKVFFIKPIQMQADCGDIQVNVEMGCLGKLLVYTRVKNIQEEQKKEESQIIPQSADIEKEEKMAKELFAGFENKEESNTTSAEEKSLEELKDNIVEEPSLEKLSKAEIEPKQKTEKTNTHEEKVINKVAKPRKTKKDSVENEDAQTKETKPVKKFSTQKKAVKKQTEDKTEK